jgi:hypothetical protein
MQSGPGNPPFRPDSSPRRRPQPETPERIRRPGHPPPMDSAPTGQAGLRVRRSVLPIRDGAPCRVGGRLRARTARVVTLRRLTTGVRQLDSADT